MPINNPLSTDRVILVPFSWGDASPKPIATIAAGKAVLTVQIVILVPFNGICSTLQLGDAGQIDRLMASTQVDPSFSAEYETNPGRFYWSTTEVILTITPGSGCTQGNGYILIEV